MYINSDQIYGNLRRTAIRGQISLLNITDINTLALKHFGKKIDGHLFLTCPYTGLILDNPTDVVLEHIISVSSGGGTVLFNCVPSHYSVNNHDEKGNKHLLEWWLSSEYFSYDKLEKLVNYIFEAYDVVFKNYSLNDVIFSYKNVLKNDDMQNEIIYNDEISINNYSYSLLGYYQLLKDCIDELYKVGYDTERYERKLQNLLDDKIFENIKIYEEIQKYLKTIIVAKTGLDNRYELTVLLNANIMPLLNNINTLQDLPDIMYSINKRIEDLEKILIANSLKITSFFDNIHDLSIFLTKDLKEFSQEEINNLIITCRSSWDKGYYFAKEYYNHYGNLKVLNNFCTFNGYDYDPDGYNLGTWISAQRQAKKKQGTYSINDEQIMKLESIGMIWEPFTEKWDFMFDLAKKYYEHYGDLDIIYNFKTKNGITFDSDGFNLGGWISYQRQTKRGNGNGNLTSEQLQKLESIGMIWELTQSKWDEMYQLAKKYYEKNGNLDIPISFSTKDGIDFDLNGKKLGGWIADQRVKYRNNINNYRESNNCMLLEELGIKWQIIEKQRRENFEYMFSLAQKYYEHFGNLNIPKRFKTNDGITANEKGVNLGTWIQSQRTKYKSNDNSNPLFQEQFKMLESIGMIWDQLSYEWNIMYSYAQKYFNYYGNLDIPVRFKTSDGITEDENGLNLGRWLTVQRRTYIAKEMSEDRIKNLEKLNIIWDVKSFEWEKMYLMSQNFYKHYGNLNIPQRFKTKDGINFDDDGEALGSWICTQRKAYISEKIDNARIQKLNEIGMIWYIERKDKKRTSAELGGKPNVRRSL